MPFETSEYMLKDIFDISKIKRFIIPDFQRNYAWGWNECEKLWDNIYNNYRQSFGNTPCVTNYFLGSIIVYKDAQNMNAQPPEVNVIDGQQRITTLLLLFRAIYHVLCQKINTNQDSSETEFIDNLKDRKKLVEKTFCQQITPETGFKRYDLNHPRLLRTKYRNTHDPLDDILTHGRIVVTEDDVEVDYINNNDNLQKFLHEKSIRNAKKRGKRKKLPEELIRYLESNEYTNYAFFVNKVNTLDTNIIGFTDHLLENCILLSITPPDESYAFIVFDILNNSGIPLEPSDIVKNYIFELVHNNNDQTNDIGNSWQMLDGICNRVMSMDKRILDINEVLKNYMNITRVTSGEYGRGWSLSKDPNIRDYFSPSKTEIFPRGYASLRDNPLDDTMNTLIDMSEFLIRAITPDTNSHDDLDQLISLEARHGIHIIQHLHSQNFIKYNYLLSLFWYQHRNDITTNRSLFTDKFNQFIKFCSSYLALTAIISMDEDTDIDIGDGTVPKLCEMFIGRSSGDSDNQEAGKYLVLTNLDYYIKKSRELLSTGPITKKLNFLPLMYCYLAFPTQPVLHDLTIEHILPDKWKQMHLLPSYIEEIKHIAKSKNINNVPLLSAQDVTSILKIRKNSKNIQQKPFEDYIDDCVQMLGNKMIMARKPNSTAQNCVFSEKIRRYNSDRNTLTQENIDFIDNYSKKENGTTKDIWTIQDISIRNLRMIDTLLTYIRSGIEGGIA
ncbi:MAG: DUF262 domain-containing protein [Proteobacteria bacterium]|nr:DUF262 domain-containing protein [Pseudomonadota bacterium]